MHNLSNDLLSLYCRTRISAIEAEFIKVATTADGYFVNWLLTHKNPGSGVGIIDFNVYAALALLAYMKAKVTDPSSPMEIQSIFDEPSTPRAKETRAKKLDYIHSFGGLIDNPEVSSLLNPFREIINTVRSTFRGGVILNTDAVYNDLIKIKGAYNLYVERGGSETELGSKSPKATTENLADQMFRYLLNRFSNEVASAADRSGESGLASAIRSGGLMDINSLQSVYSIAKPVLYMWNAAHGVLGDVYQNLDPTKWNMNYEKIKEEIIDFTSVMSYSELQEQKSIPEGATSPYMETPSTTGSPATTPPEDSGINVKDEYWLNPYVLGMLYCVISSFQYKLENGGFRRRRRDY